MLLPNGSAIKQDVIDAFNKAVASEHNVQQGIGTGTFWNFVDADMTIELSPFYADDYIYECFEALADDFDKRNGLAGVVADWDALWEAK